MDRKKIRDILIIGVILIALFAATQHFDSLSKFFLNLLIILQPFLIGGCLALFLNVPLTFFEKRVFGFMDRKKLTSKFKRPVSLVVVLAIVVLLVWLVLPVLVTELTKTIESILQMLPSAYTKLQKWLLERGFDLSEYLSTAIVAPTTEELSGQLEQILRIAFNGFIFSTGIIGSLYQSVLSIFFTIMFTVYFLLAKERLASQFKRLGFAYLRKDRMEWVLKVSRLAQRTFASFISGQCLEAIILGVMFFLIMTLFKMPYVLLISVFIAIMALIPDIGAWVGCIVGAFLILMVNPAQALGFLIIFLVLQQIEGNLIYPHVMGNAIGLPSIWVLFAVVLGEGLLGIVGMLLFIPLTSVVYKLVSESVESRLAERKLESES